MARFFENFLNRARSRRGLALVTVLWVLVLVLLSLISASFTKMTRTGINFTHNLIEAVKAEALVDAGGVSWVKCRLRHPRS